MDKDEQEWVEMNRAFSRDQAAADEEYRTKKNAAYDLLFQQIEGASPEQKQIYHEQYRQVADALLQTCIERGRAIIDAYFRHKNELEERVRNTPNDIISPFWRLRVTDITEEAPPHVKRLFQSLDNVQEIYSPETLYEYFRFFLNNLKEVEQASPVEVEVIRVTREESAFHLKGYEQEDRAVYHVDFRLEQRNLIGHDHVQNEIIGVWVSIGGHFVHRVTEWSPFSRPLRQKPDRIHRPIPKEFTDGQ